MYDVMEYEKGSNFDSWIENTYKCLPQKWFEKLRYWKLTANRKN
jgi:hypothetical protein